MTDRHIACHLQGKDQMYSVEGYLKLSCIIGIFYTIVQTCMAAVGLVLSSVTRTVHI